MITDTAVTRLVDADQQQPLGGPRRLRRGLHRRVRDRRVRDHPRLVLNFSTLNQASRCIHASRSPSGAPTDSPVAVNQTFTNCDPAPMLTELLAP
jgi:hypothetical protein